MKKVIAMGLAKKIKYGVMALPALPAYIAAFSGIKNTDIVADMAVWKRRTPCPFKSSFWVFVFLMTEYPPFRNVIYYRLKQYGRGTFYRLLLSPQHDIYLACAGTIGGGFYISHGYGTTINVQSIGKNFHIYQGVTLGLKNGGVPTVGDNVTVYAGAKILGDVSIGDNAEIGANAVVISDVPADSVAVGVPARVKLKTSCVN